MTTKTNIDFIAESRAICDKATDNGSSTMGALYDELRTALPEALNRLEAAERELAESENARKREETLRSEIAAEFTKLGKILAGRGPNHG